MNEKRAPRRGRKPKPKLKAREIQGGKYLAPLMELLRPLHGHCADPQRKLHYDELCCWLLLYFFTPALDSLRGLQQASNLAALKRKLKLPRFSLGSFSEAASIFDPALLEPIIAELGARLETDAATDPRLAALPRRPAAVDGTLLRALPSMVWALWLDDERRAAKLHLQFDLLKGIPENPVLTHGQASEIAALRARLEAGRLYVTDRGYFDFELLAAILKAQSSFVARVRNNVVYETLAEKPLAAEARRLGVEADRIVRPGCKHTRDALDRPLRLVRIAVKGAEPARGAGRVDAKSKLYRESATGHTLTLLTDQLELDVTLIALLYRRRWQIELFFRWFKKVLEADALLARSENGLTLVVYCALIASLLVSLWTGRKPTKRTYEMLCFYFSGWADEQDLAAHLERLERLDPLKKSR
jgi:hypothetical protein